MPKPLDQIDKKLLKALVEDARLTSNQLAEIAGLSASPCWQRVKRLEKEGIIKGYTTVLDNKKLGAAEIILLEITLDKQIEGAIDDFANEIKKMPEVLEAFLTSGKYDYFLKIAVNGTEEYQKFLMEKLYKIESIRETRSMFALSCVKDTQSYIPD